MVVGVLGGCVVDGCVVEGCLMVSYGGVVAERVTEPW